MMFFRRLGSLRSLLLLLCALGSVLQVFRLIKLEQRWDVSMIGEQESLNAPILIRESISRIHSDGFFILDVLSVGSNSRLEYLQTQRSSFASHKSVRYFFNVTEYDDADPQCSERLTKWKVMQISRFCRRKRKWNPKRQFLMAHLKTAYATENWLRKKPNAPGWMCAQKRPMQGLHKVMRYYSSMKNSKGGLPDYLIVMDDDTYYNIPLLQKYLKSHYPDSSKPLAMAGCRVRSPTDIVNFTIPFGGYGLVLSKGYLQNMLRPIHCPGDDPNICRAIRLTNHIDERRVFRDGMSMTELMHAYVLDQPFMDWANWTTGFCLHSDWLWGYMANFYNISDHVSDRETNYVNVREARLHAYWDSEINAGDPDDANRRICDFQRGNCHALAPACHYITPSEMKEITSIVVRHHPHEFTSLNKDLQNKMETFSSVKDNTLSLDPIVDVISIGSIERQQQQGTQKFLMSSGTPRIRMFVNVTEEDDTEPRCNGKRIFEASEAKKLVARCNSSRRQRHLKDKQSLKLSRQVYDEGIKNSKEDGLATWICDRRRPLYGLRRFFEEFKQRGQNMKNGLPDYLFLMSDETFVNMPIFPEMIRNLRDRNGTLLAPSFPWTVSGCIRAHDWEDDGFQSKFPLLDFGLILSRGLLEIIGEPVFCNESSPNREVCVLIRKNRIGERKFFLEGMTLVDMMLEYVSGEIEEVPRVGSCMTGEWALGWLIESYIPTGLTTSMHNSSTEKFRYIYPYLGSIKKSDEAKSMCRYEGVQACHSAASYCARIPHENMRSYSEEANI